MSILVAKDQVFIIPLVIGIVPGNYQKVLCAPKDDVSMTDWDKTAIKEDHIFGFSPIDFKSHTSIIDRSLDVIGGTVRVNTAAMRYNRLVSCLKTWTLKNDDGSDIPVNEETIASLPPIVAETINNEIDNMTGTM